MAPIRRYLRITKYSVLEVRIYLENPGLAQTWLLNPRDPVLPKVIESVRPLVLPKLREEKERAKKKSTASKRAIKDVVVEDDFEVAIFLTETDTRHSLLYKHKHMRDKRQTRLASNSTRLTAAASAPGLLIDLDGEDDDAGRTAGIELIRTEDGDEIPILRREESDDGPGGVALGDIPVAPPPPPGAATKDGNTRQLRWRPRRRGGDDAVADSEDGDSSSISADGGDHEPQLIPSSSSDSDSDSDSDSAPPAAARNRNRGRRHRRRPGDPQRHQDGGADDKKKMTLDISYEGFAIYGRVLCLVVKRRDAAAAAGVRSTASRRGQTINSGRAVSSSTSLVSSSGGGGGGGRGGGTGQAMMENWIASTQMPVADE